MEETEVILQHRTKGHNPFIETRAWEERKQTKNDEFVMTFQSLLLEIKKMERTAVTELQFKEWQVRMIVKAVTGTTTHYYCWCTLYRVNLLNRGKSFFSEGAQPFIQ